MKRKILLLTVTAGEGHNSITNALKTELSADPQNDIRVIDIFKKYGKPSKASFINDGYILACKYALPLYNMVFKKLQANDPEEKRYRNPAQNIVDYETPMLLADIYDFKPDVIICAHFYCGMMITNLRKKYPIPATTISILFDYTVHPFWECSTGIDYLITPTASLHDTLIYKGYKPEQLLPLGIPVRHDFSKCVTKKDACHELNLDPNLFTVMVMLGGGGFGGSEKIVKKLLKAKTELQILVVNGKDTAGKHRIDIIKKTAKTNHEIVSYGFINFVPTVMSASDLIVGKCGGVTVNESLNRERVLCLNKKLAQQEFDNMVYLAGEHSTVIYDDKLNDLPYVVDDLAQNPQKLEYYLSNIRRIRKPNALSDIVHLIKSFPAIDYSQINTLVPNEKQIRKDLHKILSAEHEDMKKSKKVKRKFETSSSAIEIAEKLEADKTEKIAK